MLIFNFKFQFFLPVFEHYRNQNWIVRPGIRVGVDFLLYSLGGPEHSHAQYGILIKDTTSIQSSPHIPQPYELSWNTHTRVLQNVAKDLLLVLIESMPHENPQSEISYLDLNSHLSLTELLIKRWNINMSSQVD